jgi:hypothetical protein
MCSIGNELQSQQIEDMGDIIFFENLVVTKA